MELNPTNPVVLQAHDNWHKIAALIMIKLGHKELRITLADVEKLMAGNTNIVLDARGERQQGYFVLRLVDNEAAAILLEEDRRARDGN